MSFSEELKYIIALRHCKLIGDVTAKKLITHFGSAENVWKASKKEISSLGGIGTKISEQISSEEIFQRLIRELSIYKEKGVGVCSIYSAQYPSLLKECIDAPIVLYTKGNMDFSLPSVSIVGTRNITAYGKKVISELIEGLSSHKINIISGLALGVDGFSHEKALDNNMSTIGVLAHGFNHFYPSQNKELASRMIKNGGMIAEFSLDTKPDKANFVQRNRVIAGLSTVTIVVESAERGGSLLTVRFANSYNREVLAVPGKITDKYSQGCNKIIKTLEAQIFTSVEDVLSILSLVNKEQSIQKEMFVELDGDEGIVYNYLKTKGKQHIDTISLDLGMPSFRLMPILLELEFKDLI